MAVADVVTLAQARLQLNMDDPSDTTDDAEVEFYIQVASDWISTQVSASDLTRPAVQMATLELIDHLWESQRGPGVDPLDDQGSFTLGLKGFAIPNRVAELLAPFASTTAPLGAFPIASTFPDPADRIVW